LAAPLFLKKIFANPAGERFVLALRKIPLLNMVSIACMPKHFHYKKNSVREVSRNDIVYHLDLSNWIEWNLFFKNKINDEENLYSLVKENMTVLDIGANMGELTLNFAKIVSEKGRIISFEPSWENFSKLSQNVFLNLKLKDRIRLYNVALGDTSGNSFLQKNDEHNSGMNSIGLTGEAVVMKSLDDIFSEEKFEHCDLIKIDVEGFELKILKGAETVIKKFKPILYLEVNNDLMKPHGDSVSDLMRWFNSNCYKIIHPVMSEEKFYSGHYDITAISSE